KSEKETDLPCSKKQKSERERDLKNSKGLTGRLRRWRTTAAEPRNPKIARGKHPLWSHRPPKERKAGIHSHPAS
ncbi:hypothetical protein PIB30_113464, partial [Stylosanthes scabra]|nr:hypothetical protein [Stylosanthes scabra]